MSSTEPSYPPPPAVPASAPSGGRGGVIALILGIVALVLALIPFASYLAGFVAIAAIIVGGIALRRALAGKRGAALTGLILGIVALILGIVLSIVYSVVFFLAAASSSLATLHLPTDLPSGLPTDLPSASSLGSAPPTAAGGSVVYSVTGSGRAMSITYLTADANGTGQEQVEKQKLPWSKSVGIDRGSAYSAFSLVAQNSGSGSITCEITLNGKVIAKKTSKGRYAVVSCTGSSQ